MTRLSRWTVVTLALCVGSVSLTACRGLWHQKGHCFYVAPEGNDAWSGLLPEPRRSGTDGPFRTISRALEAVRQLRAAQSAFPIARDTISLRKGTHFLTEPVVLQPADSNLEIAGFRNERPVLSGGRLIRNWSVTERNGAKLWVADLPEVREAKWLFRQLWVDGKRATRSRHPNQGYLSVAAILDPPADWTKGQSRFRFGDNALPGTICLSNAEIMVMTRWVESRLPVAEVDWTQHTVSCSKRAVFAMEPGDPFWVEGALDLLDEPGEWCLDPSAGRLYYLPLPGQAPEKTQVIAPVLQQVLVLDGKPEDQKWVDHVVLRNLTFSHAEWCFPSDPHPATNTPALPGGKEAARGGFSQAAQGVPGAVRGNGVLNCAFSDCDFSHLGTYALELGKGCRSNVVRYCRLFDLGAGGIKIGETAAPRTPGERTEGNLVADCQIHDGGYLFPSAVGIWIGQSPSNRIEHNAIHNFYYTGISIGWTWGYGFSIATNTAVLFNQVHHIGVKSGGDGPILSDMGGIYTLGMQPGCKVLNNLWHDIAGFRYGGWGIYFDEGSSSILAQSNVVYRTTHGGFHQHYGATNRVENNIFAFARDHQVQRSRPEAHDSFTFATNIIYFDSGTLLGGNWPDNRFKMDWNVYFDARPGQKDRTFPLGPTSMEQWRKRGHDEHSLVADPLLVAPDRGDFRLGPNSPAWRVGFAPIDLTGVGPRVGRVSNSQQ